MCVTHIEIRGQVVGVDNYLSSIYCGDQTQLQGFMATAFYPPILCIDCKMSIYLFNMHLFQISIVLVIYLASVHLDKINLEKERFAFARSARVRSIMTGKSWHQVSLCLRSGSRGCWTLVLSSFCFWFKARLQLWDGIAHFYN